MKIGIAYTLALMSGCSMLVWSNDSSAQTDGQQEPESSTVDDEIVVTGSRIARSTIDTPTPIFTIGPDDLEASGEVELSDVLVDVPSISSVLNSGTVTGDVQNSGLSSVNLRNLGDNRTLVLIDGRRTVSNSVSGNRISLSTIPSSFVSSIDVITGGSSSIYGADAVAGVVNIITSNRTGLRLNVRGGITERGDDEEYTLDASWGTKIADDRGYFLISGTYDRNYGIRASDREFATRQVDFDYNSALGINEFDTIYINEDGEPTSGDQPVSTFPPNIPRDLSSFTPGGVFFGRSSNRDRFFDAGGLVPLGPDVQTGEPIDVGTTDRGNSGYFLPGRDGFNQRAFRNLITPRERYLGAAKFSYELSDATEVFAQLQFSRVETREIREARGLGYDSTFQLFDPTTGLSSEITYGRIPCLLAGDGDCNPFVPDELRADVSTRGTGVAWDRRFSEVGQQITENRRDTLRSWAGLRGDAWEGWTWEASVGYGRYEQTQSRRNQINALHLQQGLNAERAADGTIQCADPDARASGCVPVNLFGVGSISPEAADYIRADLRQNAVIEQQSFQGYLTGSLFDLPAGPVGAAFGVDYRKDQQNVVGDELSAIGGASGNPVPNFGGSIAAFEGFAELSIPILADVPFARLLSVDISARVADYDIQAVGTVFSYRAGLQWAPVDDLRFRAQFARAQRAPDLTELFSPPRGDFDSVVDICDGVTPSSTEAIAVNCLAEPGIRAAFEQLAADGEPLIFDVGTNTYSPNAGNPDLKEETADTITFGVVAKPSFLPSLILAVDYYNIQIDDVITPFDNEDLLRLCYDTTLTRDQNAFCQDISRNPNTGEISELIQREFNLAGFDVQGIDVTGKYDFSLQDLVGIPGDFDLTYTGTHLLAQDFSFEGLDGIETIDQRGELESRTFKYRARATLNWRFDGLRLRWSANYFGKIRDSNLRLADYEELLLTNPDAEFPLFLNIGDDWEHDVFVSYQFDVAGGEMRIYGGVNNLFDRVSPFLPTGTQSGRLSNINTAYDLAGRRFYLGAVFNF